MAVVVSSSVTSLHEQIRNKPKGIQEHCRACWFHTFFPANRPLMMIATLPTLRTRIYLISDRRYIEPGILTLHGQRLRRLVSEMTTVSSCELSLEIPTIFGVGCGVPRST